MRILDLRQLDGRAERAFASVGFSVSPLLAVSAGQVVVLHLEPGGRIGRHAAASHQALLVLEGDASVSGADAEAVVAIGPGQGARWAPGENHETSSEAGMTALVIEGEFDDPSA